MTTDDVRDIFDQSVDDEPDEDEPADATDERTGSALFGDEEPSDGPGNGDPADSPRAGADETDATVDGRDQDFLGGDRDASGSSDPVVASSVPDEGEPHSADA